MARKRSPSPLKATIIKVASELFFENGYTQTTPGQVCKKADIGTGNLTYYFPTKEHMLAELVDILCDFHWNRMEQEAGEGISSILAICLELTAMAGACEDDPVIRDFFISSYTSPICLEIIRQNDAKRAKKVFRDYRPDWTDTQFLEAELLVSGIEYATLMTTATYIPFETRISGALNNILGIYGIPEETRNVKLKKVFAMDYRNIGKQAIAEFKEFVSSANEQALHQLLKR